MATYSEPAARLLALCESGDQEQLLSLLEDDATISNIINTEEIEMYPNTQFAGVTHQHLILERMIIAAARGGHVEVVSTLLKFGEQHGVAPPYMVTTSVVSAALYPAAKSLDLLLALQCVQPEVFSIRLPMGRHILEIVCLGSDSDPQARLLLLRHMMEMGFDPNLYLARHRQQRGVLLYNASRYASCEMVECLLRYGAVIAGSKALRGAANPGRIDVLEALLKHGADLNECSEKKDGDGPAGAALHVATAEGHAEVVRWLVKNGADTTLKNCNGSTPSDLLSEANNEIAVLLARET